MPLLGVQDECLHATLWCSADAGRALRCIVNPCPLG